MENNSMELTIPSIKAIKNLLEPILIKLEHIDIVISQSTVNSKSLKFYRNCDLKKLFGLSSNTIIKYRDTGILPYTKLGEVYLYEVKEIDLILKENSIKI